MFNASRRGVRLLARASVKTMDSISSSYRFNLASNGSVRKVKMTEGSMRWLSAAPEKTSEEEVKEDLKEEELAVDGDAKDEAPIDEAEFNEMFDQSKNLEDAKFVNIPDKVNAKAKEGAAAEKFEFKAETRQLLDIVTHSLYTDKEVFIRELISNASDALEKFRHAQVSGAKVLSSESPLEIRISTDAEHRTITIIDTGIGLEKNELHETLGTIARSGSKAFLKELQDQGKGGDLKSSLIGQFGVGFYSAFMVADKIDVYTRSAFGAMDDEAFLWTSDGSGNYDILPAEGVSRGTTIVLHLKESCAEFAKQKQADTIIKKYSNFVNYPVFLNGSKVNTIGALWSKSKSEITPEQHKAFFKFIGNNWMDPQYTLHYVADAPIDLKLLFYVGESHMEKAGMGRLDPGVHLYSKKVLIERNSKNLIPDWMRFVQGVVDSEDIPLNISRESMQDSALMQRIKGVVTKRFIKFLDDSAKADPAKYNTSFWPDFGQFIREGACSDFVHKEAISKLLRFQTSTQDKTALTSLDEYIARSKASQQNIYYIAAQDHEQALNSPYMEIFKRNELEVLVLTHPIDEFVMQSVQSYNSRKLKSAESEDLDLDGASAEAEKSRDEELKKKSGMSEKKLKDLQSWIETTLGKKKVKSVKTSTRLSATPAVITDHESASYRRMMKHVDSSHDMASFGKTSHTLEINPTHFIIKNLDQVRETDEQLAKEVMEQVYDNALLAAGIMDDTASVAPRVNSLLERVLALSVKDVK